MRTFNNQVCISEQLVELLDFCEIYCSAACCGINAFEIHKGLLLRKVIDKGSDGVDWYNLLNKEVKKLSSELERLSVEDNEEDIPIIYPRNDSFPEYYLPYNELMHLCKRLNIIVRQVKGSNAVP